MTKPVSDQLASVEAAIEAIEVRGQEYEYQNRRLRRADIRWLYQERDRLRRLMELQQPRRRLFYAATNKGI